MVCGRRPFQARNRAELKQLLFSGTLPWPSHLSVSKRLASLITGLLQVDPSKRLTVEEVSHHAWLTAGRGSISAFKQGLLDLGLDGEEAAAVERPGYGQLAGLQPPRQHVRIKDESLQQQSALQGSDSCPKGAALVAGEEGASELGGSADTPPTTPVLSHGEGEDLQLHAPVLYAPSEAPSASQESLGSRQATGLAVGVPPHSPLQPAHSRRASLGIQASRLRPSGSSSLRSPLLLALASTPAGASSPSLPSCSPLVTEDVSPAPAQAGEAMPSHGRSRAQSPKRVVVRRRRSKRMELSDLPQSPGFRGRLLGADSCSNA